ncbi:hypothetical protein B2G88_17110 [Natronolimnobius baerhuensis]|uniref:Uncharacterized protein n=1 Tax=Natronolimnobius baerhuensis TaxID=253108 RepID=A0A202E4I2_9EURY|nr:hypothetical protein B2G88_17110 [Natronolimnobius baerhuensis]
MKIPTKFADERCFLEQNNLDDSFVMPSPKCFGTAFSIQSFVLFAGTDPGKPATATNNQIEHAVHLYTLFEESLSVPRLETWVTRLDVEDKYEQLKHALPPRCRPKRSDVCFSPTACKRRSGGDSRRERRVR